MRYFFGLGILCFAGFLVSFTWPPGFLSEDPLSLGLIVPSEAENNKSLDGSEVIFHFPQQLPGLGKEQFLYDYGNGFYGISHTMNGGFVHDLYDGYGKRKLSHTMVLPQLNDLDAPRFFDVQVDNGIRTSSIVTWRNNIVPVGEIVLILHVADQGGEGVAGLEFIEYTYLGEKNSLGLWSLGEEGFGELSFRFRGAMEAVTRRAGGEGLTVFGRIQVPPGRSILTLMASDFAGNQAQLSFVLIGE